MELSTAKEHTSDWIITAAAAATDAKRDHSPDDAISSALTFLDAKSVVGQQVIDLLVEECAIEDLIDTLTELNRSGRICISDRLREVRQLTRRLFEIKVVKRKALVVLQSHY